MRKNRVKQLLVIIIFAFGLTIFFWPILAQGKIYSLGGIAKNDLLTYHYPNYKYFHDSLRSGKLPLWTSQQGDGFPIMAEGQLGVFYPLNLIYFGLFDTWRAMGLLLFTHFLIAAVGMYFLVYKLTRSQFASIISGFSFSLSGFMVAQQVQINYLMAFSWLPLVFLFYLKLREKFRLPVLIWLSILMAMQILSGYTTIFYYQMVVITIYGILAAGTNWKYQLQSLLIVGISLLIAASISAVQLVPTTELFSVSTRISGISLAEEQLFSFPKEAFLGLLGIKFPKDPELEIRNHQAVISLKNPYAYYLYIGLIPIIAALFGIWIMVKRKNFALLLTLLWVFLMALGAATPVFKIFYSTVPGMKYVRHAIRFLAFVEFFLVMLAGIGMAHFEKFIIGRKKLLILGTILAIIFVDLYCHEVRINPLSVASDWLRPEIVSYLKPSNLFRVSGYNLNRTSYDLFSKNEVQKELLNFLPPNYTSVFSLLTNDVYTALDFSSINPFPFDDEISDDLELGILRQQEEGNWVNEVILTDDLVKAYQVQAIKYIIFAFPLQNPSLKLLWHKTFSNPSFEDIFTREVSSQGQLVKLVPHHLKISGVFLYELSPALPRVRLVGEAVSGGTSMNREGFFTSDINMKEQIRLEELVGGGILGGEGEAEIVSDTGNSVEISTQTDGPSWLYLADTYYPGWKAYIDGKETQIYKADYAFRAVKLETAGNHKVIFRYEPLSLKLGGYITFGTLVLIGVYFLRRYKK